MSDKRTFVHAAFSAIANRYDFLNTLLSFNLDRGWRRQTVSCLELGGSEVILDVASGTGRLALETAQALGKGGRVLALDFCLPMLERARGLSERIDLILGTAEDLPFPDASVDRVTIAFGLRNVPDIKMTLREAARVLRPGGRLVCLEFSRPRAAVVRFLHGFYLLRVLPAIGWIISGNRDAYLYLPRSIMAFPQAEELVSIMKDAGLDRASYRFLTWGVVALHIAVKA